MPRTVEMRNVLFFTVVSGLFQKLSIQLIGFLTLSI